MSSQLTFDATQYLRNALIVRNLPPYEKENTFTPPPPPTNYEYNQSDFSVIDSPDEIIEDGRFSKKLYGKNKYGPDGGYGEDAVDIGVNILGSNEGPYDYSDGDILSYSQNFLKDIGLNNIYSPIASLIGGNYGFVYTVDTTPPQPPPSWGASPYLPYWEPPSFTPSSYDPYEILTKASPNGTDGLLKSDSVMVQNNAAALRTMLQYRVQQNLYAETLGRINIIDALNDPTDFVAILGGKSPIIQPNYQITVSQSIIARSADFLARLEGVYYPASPIPGDYFEETYKDNNNEKTVVGQTIDYIGRLFGLGGRKGRTPSQLFLDNTGPGQKKLLSRTIVHNKYRPQYVTNSSANPVGFVSRLLGVQFPEGNYYIGSADRNPSFINSPAGQIPLDANGMQVDAIVLGPDVIAKDFEGVDNEFKFGLGGTSYGDGGGIQAGMSWNSQKFGDNRGFKVGVGGEIIKTDNEFAAISSQYDLNKSTNYPFKEGSILYNTQKLIDSQPANANRYAHAGNAIDQVSKVFNDGYREITKGSRVISYVTENGVEKGQEYCRIFTKDTPYLTYADLQKTDGNIRKFNYSVLDSTYNLNIAPLKGNDSTNIIQGGGGNLGYVKKYMFSIENLAWRTSSRPGFRYEDLPVCERGANGGRIMWFPPYDLTFNEDTRADFNNHSFLGRPEPVFTYKNTTRSGTLKWKIVVDHPSILNAIVNKVLSKDTNKDRVNSIIESFFSGCKKYDIYDLAIKYPSIPISELQLLQSVINNPNSSQENVRDAYKQNTIATSGLQNPSSTDSATSLNDFVDTRFYFPTLPAGGSETVVVPTVSYREYYIDYLLRQNQYSPVNFISTEVTPSYNKLNDLALMIFDAIKNKGAKNIKLTLKSAKNPDTNVSSDITTFAPNQTNENTASARGGSIETFLKEQTFENGNESFNLASYINDKKLIIKVSPETDDIVTNNGTYTCSYNGDSTPLERMACSSIKIQKIEVEIDPSSNVENESTTPIEQEQPTLFDQSREGITKRLLRNLLSECDYFETIKEDNPTIYDSLQQKLKYFQPAFHSITPEGLNSRLTFLQQCMRPGDTIPTIAPDGTLKTTDAINTSFGAPPVLIIRVGDFYNTKIIPSSLSLRYEHLDLNPEGIGIQPMIAEVTMTFNFIGGHGLKEPVQRLQNALSFNYYANTEMYDERATATEDTSALDKKVLDAILNAVPPPTAEITNIVNNGGNTIGNIISSSQSTSAETGTLSYSTIANNVISQSQDYFNSTINGFEGVVRNYNYDMLNLISDSRKYSTGSFGSTTTSLVGKSTKISDNIENLFNSVISDIENGTNGIISELINGVTVISNSDIRAVKKNYKNYLNSLKNNFTNSLNTTINDIVKSQESLVFTVDQLNFVIDQKTDGLITSKGDVKIYRLIVNNDYNTLLSDYERIALGVDDFHVALLNGGLLFNSFNLNSYTTDQKEAMLITQTILTQMNNFIDILAKNVTGADTKSIIEQHCSELYSQYIVEQTTALELVSEFKKLPQFSKFTPLTTLPTERTINFQTTPATSTEKTMLTNLYDGENSGNANTYNGKVNFL